MLDKGGEITSLGATELALRIASGELSAVEVTEAHIRRIEAVNGRLNAVVVPLFDEARAAAQAADEALRQRKPLGPLHGVPVTIKESFDVAGAPTTVGLTSRAGHRADRDAPLVLRLREAGAIVLGKTNVPQLCAFFETDNPLHGVTLNPLSPERSCGGSSGGEAAIIAAHGSSLGLGTDGGGSIRQPAHSCGICGLKPTAARLTLEGHFSIPNWLPEWIQPGPMARRVADLSLAMRALTSAPAARQEAAAVPVSWADPANVSIRGLRVGCYVDDGFLRPAPALRRAVHEAAAILRGRGVEVEEFAPPDVEEAYWLYFQIFTADGLAVMRKMLAGSRWDWRIRRLVLGALAPGVVRQLGAPILELAGRKHEAAFARRVFRRKQSLEQYWGLLEDQRRVQQRFHEALQARRLDAILCPPSALPALRHGTFYGSFAGGYTILFNVLGLPAGVVPFTRVREGEESDRGKSRDPVLKDALRTESGSAGLPVGVQIAGRPWREDIVLALLEAVEAGASKA